MKGAKNVIGPQVKALRKELALSQNQLAAKLQIEGLIDIRENVVSKIEGQFRNVTDYEVAIIAKILNVTVDRLFPSYSVISENIEDIRRPPRSNET